MKKKIVIPLVALLLIAALFFTCGLFCRPKSFEWEGMSFNLPDNFKYKFNKVSNHKTIHIFPDDTPYKQAPWLVISRDIEKGITTEEIMNEYNNNEQLDVLNYSNENFNGESALVIDMKANNGIEYKEIYIIKKNIIMVLQHNNRERFKQFEPVFESIKFVD